MLLLSFAILAIGFYVLPSTMSAFVGQHSWYSVRTDTQKKALCEKCHSAEVAEFDANTGAHAAYVSNTGETCSMCHRVNLTRLANEYNIDTSNLTNFNYTIWNETGEVTNTSWSWRNKTTPHAAVTVDCVDCHVNATTQLSNQYEAHRPFWNQTTNASLNPQADTSTACVACHTHTHLNITWVRSSGFDIYGNNTNQSAGWILTVTINQTDNVTTRSVD